MCLHILHQMRRLDVNLQTRLNLALGLESNEGQAARLVVQATLGLLMLDIAEE